MTANNELITRLRERAAALDRFGFTETVRRLRAAADALEAAQAEVEELLERLRAELAELCAGADVRRHFAAEAHFELAAERAVASRWFEALELAWNYPQPKHVMDEIRAAREAYIDHMAAHRERRTTPTKPADDKTRCYGAPTKENTDG